MGGMDPTPVGMPLEKHSASQLLPRRLRMLWTPLATPGRQHSVLRHMISVPHPTRLPYRARSPGPARQAQPGSPLDPRCRNSIPHTRGMWLHPLTDAAQDTKLLFMPRVRAEPAATAGQQHRQTHGSCWGKNTPQPPLFVS